MKKLLSLLLVAAFAANSFAAAVYTNPVPAPVKASDVKVPIGKTGLVISLQDLSEIKVKEFEQLTGKKMSFANKMMFKKAQKELRAGINADGTISNKKLTKFALKKDGDSGFHIGGFALGFLLGLIGVLIAYLINDDKKQNRVKWAWLGVLAWLVIFLIILLA